MRSEHRYIQRFGSFYRHRGNLYYFIIKEGILKQKYISGKPYNKELEKSEENQKIIEFP